MARQLVCWDKSSPSLFLYHLTQGALSLLSSCDKGADSADEKGPPKDNPAWVTVASLGCLSWNCLVSHPHYPLTNGSQGTDAEIRSHWQLCSQQHVKIMEIYRQIRGLPYVKVSKPWYKKDFLIKQAYQDTNTISGGNKFFLFWNKCQPWAVQICSLLSSSDRLQVSAQTLLWQYFAQSWLWVLHSAVAAWWFFLPVLNFFQPAMKGLLSLKKAQHLIQKNLFFIFIQALEQPLKCEDRWRWSSWLQLKFRGLTQHHLILVK